MNLGPNHKMSCAGAGGRFSGKGYNRVRICGCGAEDHAPDPGSVQKLMESLREIADFVGEEATVTEAKK